MSLRVLTLFMILYTLPAITLISCSHLPTLPPAATYTPTVGVSQTTTFTMTSTATPTVPVCNNGGSVSTFAGTYGVAGSTDGTGTSATFEMPYYFATDHAGNVYVSDVDYSVIRKITPTGVVTTIAGQSGVQGYVDGPANTALFGYLFGVGVDGSGNVYVVDSGNHVIRKITSTGIVSTFAGSGTYGLANGIGTAASFGSIMGLAVDPSGNIYVTEQQDIRKITPGGVVSTFVGTWGNSGSTDGVGAAASFAGAQGIACDPSGNLYVGDWANNNIRKVTSSGLVTTLAGTAGVIGSANGTGGAASFYEPQSVAVDACGNVFVADLGNGLIRKITPGGVVSTLANCIVRGVAVDPSDAVYVSDDSSHVIRVVR